MNKAYNVLLCSFILATTSTLARAQVPPNTAHTPPPPLPPEPRSTYIIRVETYIQNNFKSLDAIISEISRVKSLCPRGTEAFRRPQGKFIITGRGSNPPSPLDPLSGNNITSTLATLDTSKNEISIRQAPLTYPTPTIEAQGFRKNSNGDVELVAVAPLTTPSGINVARLPCPKN
ncbi:hypothetical protein CAL7716_059240 [Calothrix sp. PCC 7716]|nr:hypothetical protein CAL7716_059240 [Calothrix sp. PCC 7716]